MDKLLTPADLARLLGVKLSTIYTWKHKGVSLPPRIEVGNRLLRFRQQDVEAWLEKGTTSPAPPITFNENGKIPFYIRSLGAGAVLPIIGTRHSAKLKYIYMVDAGTPKPGEPVSDDIVFTRTAKDGRTLAKINGWRYVRRLLK